MDLRIMYTKDWEALALFGIGGALWPNFASYWLTAYQLTYTYLHNMGHSLVSITLCVNGPHPVSGVLGCLVVR